MHPLPEATERIYTSVGGVLHVLPLQFGWGRAKLSLSQVAEGKDGQRRTTTLDALFQGLLRTQLLQPLASVADQYLTALDAFPDLFPDAKLAKSIHAQLSKFKLADEDIDLLLCLIHLMGRDLTESGLPQLKEPDFYQSVFVDEVQDFTEQQVFLMVEQSDPRSRAVTVVGDIAQKLHHGSSIDLKACFPRQTVPHVMLTENLRQADVPGLALFSASFRAVLQSGEKPSASLAEKARKEGPKLVRPRLVACESEDIMDARIIDALTSAKLHQTLAVLFPDSAAAARTYQRLALKLREGMVEAELSAKVNLARRHVRHFADVANSKGLEFDVVLLVGIERYDLRKATDVNRLYVGITRACQSLMLLFGTKELAVPLADVRALYQELVGPP